MKPLVMTIAIDPETQEIELLSSTIDTEDKARLLKVAIENITTGISNILIEIVRKQAQDEIRQQQAEGDNDAEESDS